MIKHISDNEIAVHSYEDAVKICEILLNNNNVCMLSREEDLYIINFEWEEYCDRNGIIFRSLESWEWEQEKESRVHEDIQNAYNEYVSGVIDEDTFIDAVISVRENEEANGDCFND